MAFSEETYIKIFRYLENDLSSQERADFEQEINASEELAREVALQSEMNELLADSPENELRKNLDTLSRQAQDKEPPGGFPPYFLWGIPLLLAAAVAWWLLSPSADDANSRSGLTDSSTPSSTITPPSSPSSSGSTDDGRSPEDSTAVLPVDSNDLSTNGLTDADSPPIETGEKEEEAADVGLSRRSATDGGQGGGSTTAAEPPKTPKAPEESKEMPPDSTISVAPPDSAIFNSEELFPELKLDTTEYAQIGLPPSLEPIPELNSLIGQTLNFYGFILQAEQKQQDVQLNAPRGPVAFRFAGKVLPDPDSFNPADTSVAEQFYGFLQENTFELQLYSNDEAAYEAGEPLYNSQPINLNLTSNQKSADFEVRITLNLNPGRHYYLIKSTTDGKIFFVDEFIVIP
ncbi:MAG: hypothetical protein AAGG75_02865 [Bacteroidota bacterium]